MANQKSGGVHANVSGGAVLKNLRKKRYQVPRVCFIKRRARVICFIKHGYPVNPMVASDDFVKNWGVPKMSNLDLNYAGELQKAAIKPWIELTKAMKEFICVKRLFNMAFFLCKCFFIRNLIANILLGVHVKKYSRGFSLWN